MMKARILIIDDEESIRFTLDYFLSKEGHDTITAEDYDEAMEKISNEVFDLIIADVFLKGKSGIDFLREINARNLSFPVIMITGSPDIETATEALRLGAFDYVSKPVKRRTLLHVTNIALRQKALNDEKEKYRLNLEAIFRSVKDGIITVDNNLMVNQINDAALRIYGYSQDDIGENYRILKKLCDKKLCNGKCIEALEETIRRKQPVEVYRHECKRKGGKIKVLTLTTSPLHDEQGKVLGAVVVIKDETRIADLERNMQVRKRFNEIVGKSKKMQRIYSRIEDLSNTQTTVLITGESGTGKELLVDALHYNSIFRDKPLVKINCSALQESLLESELFGHVSGAFTGAIKDKIGRFQKADGGTIFLDEIGDLSMKIQLKLLRVLQGREFEKVGDTNPIKVNVRVVAATNRDLRKKVSLGEFREDLYYRLKVVEIDMPSLRDNKEDIPLLTKHFLQKFNEKINRKIKAVSSDVLKIFMKYTWPGNIRELENTLEHAFILCHDGTITVNHLPADLKQFKASDALFHGDRDSNDVHMILKALKKSGWNKAKAARMLNMSRQTIYRKIRELKITES